MSEATLPALLDRLAAAQAYSVSLIDGLDGEQIFWRPNENSSAIAWHLGHQGAVSHYLVRNLTAAEVSFNVDYDRVFDSATPEPGRGVLPPLDEILGYRTAIAVSTRATIDRIEAGDVGAPAQLALIGQGLLRAAINHEYQHAKWIDEGRSTMVGGPSPVPEADSLIEVDGYWMLDEG